MLPEGLLLSALEARKCVRTRTQLAEDECLVSRAAFPALYASTWDASEDAYLKELSRGIAVVLTRTDLAIQIRDEIQRFMALVIDSGEMYREEFVHRYVFEFWDTLWEHPEDALPLAERYFKGNPLGATSPFATGVLPRLRTPDAEVDIVALGGAARTHSLFAIEIKLGELDDRAIGQILRYYRVSRDACDRYYHGCDIREVVPMLVVKSASLAIWDAIPQYFREILRLYSYRVVKGRVVLSDTRRKLQALARDRLYA
jgi:hypothetical protein